MRIILYTGKGGVGKTSLSAATAVRCAELGYRTVVLSTDAAHSLGDSLDHEVGTDATEIVKNLHAVEIDVNQELSKNWGKIQEFATRFLKARGFEEVMAEEFAVLPGMEELFSLLKLKEFHEQELFDVAIIDCAPTGSTIRMLSMPDLLRWYFEKIFNMHRRVVRAVRPIAERISSLPIPSDDVFVSLHALYRRIDGLREILCDPAQSSIRHRLQVRVTARMGNFSARDYAIDFKLHSHGRHCRNEGDRDSFFLKRPCDRRPAASA